MPSVVILSGGGASTAVVAQGACWLASTAKQAHLTGLTAFLPCLILTTRVTIECSMLVISRAFWNKSGRVEEKSADSAVSSYRVDGGQNHRMN